MHRDLKPNNVLIANENIYGDVCSKLIDFGNFMFFQDVEIVLLEPLLLDT